PRNRSPQRRSVHRPRPRLQEGANPEKDSEAGEVGDVGIVPGNAVVSPAVLGSIVLYGGRDAHAPRQLRRDGDTLGTRSFRPPYLAQSCFTAGGTPALPGATAMPHGPSGTLIVAVTRPEAVSITETSFERPFAVYSVRPSRVRL